MLNWIWLGMILIAVLVGGFSGRLELMTAGAIQQAEQAVIKIALPLIGLFALWLGVMRLAERAGLIHAIARGLRPVMRRLFPDVPPDHPAMGSMVLAMSANMLGLGNAATPLGLRAMSQLNQLNNRQGTATNSMVTFLVICTASIQLLPTTSISFLALAPSQATIKSDPTAIVAPAFIATVCALCVGLFLARFLSRFRVFAPSEDPTATVAASTGSDTATAEVAAETVQPNPLSGWGKAILRIYYALFVVMLITLVNPWGANSVLQSIRDFAPWLVHKSWSFSVFWTDSPGVVMRTVRGLSMLAIPFMLSFFPLYAALRGVRVYEQFCDGAKEAFATGQRVIPFLVAMLVAMRLLRDSGTLGMLTDALKPMLAAMYFPADILPLALMRPLSGSASQGIMADLINNNGAHTLVAKMAATIYGSTETTFYVIAVYFGSVGVRNARHAVIAGLAADLTALIVAVTMCNLMFA